MSESDYKPRGGIALFAFVLLAISLPAVGIIALSYFQIISLPNNFTDRILTQIGWSSVFSLPMMIVVYLVAKKISGKVNNDKS